MKKWIIGFLALAVLAWSGSAWATCANYATYADGQILTAASLNSLQTNYTDCSNNILNGDVFTGDMQWHSGVDIEMFSDAGSALTFEIEGSGGNITTINSIGGALSAGQFSNCGMTYGTATLSITDEAGAALSATNPCCIGIAGATAGQNGTLCFTAPASSTFGATSDTDGNTFGITATAGWASDAPFFLYACRGSASNYFGFSRDPRKTVTGAAAGDLAQEGDTDGDGQADLFIMNSGLTLASEAAMPCQVVGSFTATWSTTDDNWVVTALDAADGFGRFQEGVRFVMPLGQNGNEAGKLYTTDGATALAFTSYDGTYRVGRDGVVTYAVACENQTQVGADGTAVNFYAPLKSAPVLAGITLERYFGEGVVNAASILYNGFTMIPENSLPIVVYRGNTALNDNHLSGASDYVYFSISYPAF